MLKRDEHILKLMHLWVVLKKVSPNETKKQFAVAQPFNSDQK